MLFNQPWFQNHVPKEEVNDFAIVKDSGENANFGIIRLFNCCLLSTCYVLSTFVAKGLKRIMLKSGSINF